LPAISRRNRPAVMQIREFLQIPAAAMEEPLIAKLDVSSWQQALATVSEHWQGRGKFILAMDEFQWTAGTSPELPSVLQGLWDGSWRSRADIFLILCGSFVGYMERELLGQRSPLFGRRTGQIQLEPFGYRDASEFHPRYFSRDHALT
jgi:AAA+ ATPase superfamily predicted ATPase